MSLRSVELWRPRREPKLRARRALVGTLALALLIGALAAALLARRPLVLGVGLAGACAVACAGLWWVDRRATWDATRPRPWVPRGDDDRRTARGAGDRRATRRPPAPLPIAPAPCNTQPEQHRVAIGGRRQL